MISELLELQSCAGCSFFSVQYARILFFGGAMCCSSQMQDSSWVVMVPTQWVIARRSHVQGFFVLFCEVKLCVCVFAEVDGSEAAFFKIILSHSSLIRIDFDYVGVAKLFSSGPLVDLH